MQRKAIETYPPFFLEDFPSDTDSGRVQLIRHSLCLYEMAFACSIPRFPNDFRAKSCDRLRFEIGADYGRFFSGFQRTINPGVRLMPDCFHKLSQWTH